jgi:hypothetical protein
MLTRGRRLPSYQGTGSRDPRSAREERNCRRETYVPPAAESQPEYEQVISELQPCTGNHYVTYPVKEHSRLPEHVPRLDEFPQTFAERLVAVVHLAQAGLVLLQCHVELVDGVRCARADGDERCRVIQQPHRDLVRLLLNLRLEETKAAGHLVDAPNLADERALKRVHVGVELSKRECLVNTELYGHDLVRTSLN